MADPIDSHDDSGGGVASDITGNIGGDYNVGGPQADPNVVNVNVGQNLGTIPDAALGAVRGGLAGSFAGPPGIAIGAAIGGAAGYGGGYMSGAPIDPATGKAIDPRDPANAIGYDRSGTAGGGGIGFGGGGAAAGQGGGAGTEGGAGGGYYANVGGTLGGMAPGAGGAAGTGAGAGYAGYTGPGTGGGTGTGGAFFGSAAAQAGVAPTSLTTLAQADANAAAGAYNLADTQYQWGQNQFNTVWPYAQRYLQGQIDAGNAATAAGNQYQQLFTGLTAPTLASFTNTANTFNNPAQAAVESARAQADVANQFQAARENAVSNLESYGVDPSQTRFGALDFSSRLQQAAAQANAATQSRLQTQATGLGLQAQAINAGMALPGLANQSYQTGANVGGAGLTGANTTTTTGANIMGTPTQWSGLGINAAQAGAGALNAQNTYNLGRQSLQYTKDVNQSQGTGSLIGGALGALGSFGSGTSGNFIGNIGSGLANIGTGIGSFLQSI